MRRTVEILLSVALAAAAAAAGADDLFALIRANDLAGLKQRLAAGADVQARDRRGATPLMHAAAFGSLEAVKLLVGAGADVKATSSFGATALHWGAGDPGKVRLLVELGADVNARTKQATTPLVATAAHGESADAVRLLLAKGADPRPLADWKTETMMALGSPLIAASQAVDVESLRLLIARGAEVNAANGAGFTALINAAGENDLEAVKLLLAKGADVHAANSSGGTVKNGPIALKQMTPLLWAAPFAAPALARALLDAGAKVDARDIRGMTPLMLAAGSETHDLATMRLLISRGADVNARSATGETALDWAKKHNDPAVLRLLREAGAKDGAPFKPPVRPVGSAPASPRTALERSLPLLQRAGAEFFLKGGCVGCHHQNVIAMAVGAARDRGVAVDEAASRESQKTVRAFWTPAQEMLLQMIDPPGSIDQTMFSLIGMAAEKVPADLVSDSMTAYLAGRQRADGSWMIRLVSRPPMEDGGIQRTALALRSLQLYGFPGRKAEFDERVRRARRWLLAARPKTTDDAAMRLLGLHWSQAEAARVHEAARYLAGLQRADGGWAQTAHLASDAYATGEALWALHDSGQMKASDETYRRGVRFLLATQFPDGSWYVRSRSPKFQPYFESGFPFGHDQWISTSATALASIALAAAVEPAKPAARPSGE